MPLSIKQLLCRTDGVRLVQRLCVPGNYYNRKAVMESASELFLHVIWTSVGVPSQCPLALIVQSM